MHYILNRLREPSTWMGLVPAVLTVLTTFDVVKLSPDQYDAVKDHILVLLCGGFVATKDSSDSD